MKTYVLTISKTFPATHFKKGEATNFWPRIQSGDKKHTIRDNYALWKKRIDEVNKGEAIISLREWSGKPYKSNQHELHQFTKGKIGIQKLTASVGRRFADGKSIDMKEVAMNDGLEYQDFVEWFKGYKLTDEGFAIIHFTGFRY